VKPLAGALVLIVCFASYCFFKYDSDESRQRARPIEKSIWLLGSEKLELEIMMTEKQRRLGLMYRKEALKGNKGMLFYYEEAEELGFWNNNVSFNIDVAYFDKEARLICVKVLKAQQQDSVFSETPAQYVIEMREGWFKEKAIKKGQLMEQLLKTNWKALKQNEQ
jgi:uncharacterized membrane protein (UPF0127 family)